MRHVRPIDPDLLAPGQKGPWLLDAGDEAGCLVRACKGGGSDRATAEPFERFALILKGEAAVQSARGATPALAGDLVFIPAHQAAGLTGSADTVWIEIETTARGAAGAGDEPCRVIKVDPARFQGKGFAHQCLIDRKSGAQTLRMNILQVEPGSGSPNFHIHAFNQMYVILEGEMTIDVGRARLRAGPSSFVYLPAGLVHRNFNASDKRLRNITLLVPEPLEDEIFDFAVSIHDREAELLAALPASPAVA